MIDFFVLGSGVSGSTIANVLSSKYSVHVFDKARGPGGRSSNKRFKNNLSFDQVKNDIKNDLTTNILNERVYEKANSFYEKFIESNDLEASLKYVNLDKKSIKEVGINSIKNLNIEALQKLSLEQLRQGKLSKSLKMQDSSRSLMKPMV